MMVGHALKMGLVIRLARPLASTMFEGPWDCYNDIWFLD